MNELQKMAKLQKERWDGLGCEVVRERGVPRLPEFKKEFKDDVEVKIRNEKTGKLSPFKLRTGRTLMASECMAERADLALDEDGVLVSQLQFEANYAEFLQTFVYGAGCDYRSEPVPNVKKYLNARTDPHSASSCTVEIDYEPKFEAHFQPDTLIDRNGNDAAVGELTEIVKMLAESKLAEDTAPDGAAA